MPELKGRRCSIAGALELVGERWSLLVLRELSYGRQRFSDIQRNTGAPRDILTSRLRKLEEVGVLERVPDPLHPSRTVYQATRSGRALNPVLIALKEWGDRHVFAGDEPVVTQHVCGAEFHPRVHCAACHEPLRRDELRVVRGDRQLV